MATKHHFHRPLRPHHLPGVAVAEPFVGALHLPAVLNILVKNAELVANSIAQGRNFQRRHGVQIAGRQPSQATIAQTRLLFLGQQFIKI